MTIRRLFQVALFTIGAALPAMAAQPQTDPWSHMSVAEIRDFDVTGLSADEQARWQQAADRRLVARMQALNPALARSARAAMESGAVCHDDETLFEVRLALMLARTHDSFDALKLVRGRAEARLKDTAGAIPNPEVPADPHDRIALEKSLDSLLVRDRFWDEYLIDHMADDETFAGGDLSLLEAWNRLILHDRCRLYRENALIVSDLLADGGARAILAGTPVLAAGLHTLLVHADMMPGVQERGLTLLEPLARAGQADGEAYAALYDRVALNTGRKQRYGTQLDCRTDGRFVPRPLENPGAVDRRRKALGLEPLEAYLAGAPNCG